jgi:NitT/TauT family transport system ATP-binding protein
VIIATHDLAEAVTLADRIVLMAGRPAKVRLEEIVPGTRPRSADDVERIAKALRPLLQDGLGDSHPEGVPPHG